MNKAEIKKICSKQPEEVTMAEYQNLKLTMLNQLGRINGTCNGIRCMDCCLNNEDDNNYDGCTTRELLSPEKATKCIQEWHKENTLKVDWSKVPVDTKIIVWEDGRESYKVKRHFAKFEDGKIYAWVMGATSWSIDYDVDVSCWDNAELAEVADE